MMAGMMEIALTALLPLLTQHLTLMPQCFTEQDKVGEEMRYPKAVMAGGQAAKAPLVPPG